MVSETIDYAGYIDEAMRGAVRQILRHVEKDGLPGQHHFFISYRTDYPGVEMSDILRSKYPREITIVLQHQFWDLHVTDDQFRVTLSFSNIPEKLVVPFAALIGFADPSTKFGLQFHNTKQEVAAAAKAMGEEGFEDAEETETNEETSSKVIALDAFRKK